MIDLKKYLEDQEQLLINTNYAMFTSHLFYNASRHSLMFLVKHTPSNTFIVKEAFIDEVGKMATYQLSSSKVVPDMSKGYAYINFPNVNFVGENIVYNYPVESSIYMLDIRTNERKYILADSHYTSMMELGSLVTLVTSLPTGIWFSWAWDSCSMWVKVSRRIWDRIFWPVFCRIMA